MLTDRGIPPHLPLDRGRAYLAGQWPERYETTAKARWACRSPAD